MIVDAWWFAPGIVSGFVQPSYKCTTMWVPNDKLVYKSHEYIFVLLLIGIISVKLAIVFTSYERTKNKNKILIYKCVYIYIYYIYR